MTDFVAAVVEESGRFAHAASLLADLADPASVSVPTCPDWSVDDLVWHLTEVQHFWASIVDGRLDDPGAVVPLDRPPTGAMVERFEATSRRLAQVLADAEPSEPCWSWYGAGRRVGWVRRRQANEALIHRIDAELSLASAGGPPPGPIDAELAADGIDEMLRVMLGVDPLPAWADWAETGPEVRLVASGPDGSDRSWRFAIGRFTGTGPDGTAYDEAAIRVAPTDDAATGAVELTVRGTAAEIDLWLWGRGGLDHASDDGDRALLDRIRALAQLE